MRTLGLIGGTSWVSTQQYYLRLNQIVAERLPGHNARLAMWSTNFAEFHGEMDWEQRYAHHLKAAKGLAAMGAEGLVICANTLHRFADQLVQDQDLPIVNLIDAVGDEIKAQGLATAGILGTIPTMTEDFYAGRLLGHGIKTLVPDEAGREEINRTIYEELTRFNFLPATRSYYAAQIQSLAARGAECVILGCTEIPLLMEGMAASVPLLDTIEVHCQAAISFALSG